MMPVRLEPSVSSQALSHCAPNQMFHMMNAVLLFFDALVLILNDLVINVLLINDD